MIYQVEATYTPEYLREHTPEDLKDCIEQAQKLLLGVRTIAQSQKVQQTHLFKKIKKDIARMKTILNESR